MFVKPIHLFLSPSGCNINILRHEKYFLFLFFFFYTTNIKFFRVPHTTGDYRQRTRVKLYVWTALIILPTPQLPCCYQDTTTIEDCFTAANVQMRN